MRRLVHLALFFSAAAGAAEPPVHHLAPAFSAFWDRTRDEPMPVRVKHFKEQVAPSFPAFYGVARYGGARTQAEQDRLIEKAIADFPAIRERYARKAAGLEAQLRRHQQTLKKNFPDYRPDTEIYLLHSLGEMDAGPRSLAGRDVLVFGVDLMAKLHGDDDESAFFQHELFHLHHQRLLGDCESGKVWSSLWKEGLATHVSQQLNPDASERELLLDFPAGMPARTRAALPAALAQLEAVLDSEDAATWGGLFHTRTDDGTALPGRRGYYLGYLVAKEAGKRHTMQELARLDCSGARATVQSALRGLREEARKSDRDAQAASR